MGVKKGREGGRGEESEDDEVEQRLGDLLRGRVEEEEEEKEEWERSMLAKTNNNRMNFMHENISLDSVVVYSILELH